MAKKGKYVITAIENDGRGYCTLTIVIEVLKDGLNVIEACMNAAREYTVTENGYKDYIRNNRHFDWGDFVDCVPNEICEKHGIRVVRTTHADVNVDNLDQLVDEPAFHVEDIQWDTDGDTELAADLKLPKDIDVPVSSLLYDKEDMKRIDIEEVKERVVDWLSDQFGFCIYGCSIS